MEAEKYQAVKLIFKLIHFFEGKTFCEALVTIY